MPLSLIVVLVEDLLLVTALPAVFETGPACYICTTPGLFGPCLLCSEPALPAVFETGPACCICTMPDVFGPCLLCMELAAEPAACAYLGESSPAHI